MQIHPCSVNFNCTKFESPWLVYAEMVSTSAVYLRDCTMVGVDKCGEWGVQPGPAERECFAPASAVQLRHQTCLGVGNVPTKLPQRHSPRLYW